MKIYKHAIVLVSGGMDSCVTAAIASRKAEKISFLHVNYGQRTEKREQQAFNDIADFYDVPHTLTVDISHLKQIGGTSLVGTSIDIPEGEPDRKGVPNTYVPFRNGNIISIAAAWAEVLKADAIYIGVVEEDSSGYPDCRASFINAMEAAINAGTTDELRVSMETPLIELSKKQIVEKGMELNAPLHLTWSCYRSEDEACGTCDSCMLRLRGFSEAGMDDPIVYRK